MFHLGKNIYKKIVELGLQKQYQTCDILTIKVRSLIALAFLPETDVVDGFLEICANDKENDLPADLLKYLETNLYRKSKW